MCGLTGFFDLRRSETAEAMQQTLLRMTDAIHHRGPDDEGSFIDASAGVALGFRRLAIIDTSPSGHQPMVSASGRFVMAFNGEVYNFEAIRAELQAEGLAPAFRGHSDTEVMLAAFEAWGAEAAVKRFIGMFAIALWDGATETLSLIRDRVGVKPMYFAWSGTTLIFGSELKALRRHPRFERDVSPDVLALYFRFGYVPSPYSIYAGCQKLPPGTILTISRESGTAQSKSYWSAADVIARGADARTTLPEKELTGQLDSLLRDAVGLRMISDVALGAFLSGGVDSSLVVALMQQQSSRPVKTFSIGFRESGYDEAPHAARVARHLGTDHTELYVTSREALDVVPRLQTIYDEPFADSSQIPVFLVAALARRHVTVSLSGDGGDELFGGYNRYFLGRALLKKTAHLPRMVRHGIAKLLSSASTESWDNLLRLAAPLFPAAFRQARTGEKIHKLSRVLHAGTAETLYRELVSHWHGVVAGAVEISTIVDRVESWPPFRDPIEMMMFLDLVTYLPDEILVKVDRASMAVSLEAREPLLDHRLVEFAWSLPLEMRLGRSEGKRLLRQVLYQYVPRELIERPKAGFAVPIGQWLRGPLRDWAEALLDERSLRDSNLVPALIRPVWSAHLKASGNFEHHLWQVLMYQAWRSEETRVR